MNLRKTLLTATLFATVSTSAYAREVPEGWQMALGAGLLMNPAFRGAKDYQLSLLPYIRINYGDKFFASMHEGAGFNLIQTNSITAGPIVRYRFSRKESDGTSPFRIAGSDTNALQGLGDVDGAFEPGAFINYRFRPFSVELEVRRGFGGHEGWVSDINLNYSTMLFWFGKRTIFNIGPRANLVSDNHNEAYYSINSVQSAQSGLPVYNASGGFLSYGVGASGIVAMTRKLSMVLFAGYDRMAGDAANSPLVSIRGSKNQATLGLFLAYQFGGQSR